MLSGPAGTGVFVRVNRVQAFLLCAVKKWYYFMKTRDYGIDLKHSTSFINFISLTVVLFATFYKFWHPYFYKLKLAKSFYLRCIDGPESMEVWSKLFFISPPENTLSIYSLHYRVSGQTGEKLAVIKCYHRKLKRSLKISMTFAWDYSLVGIALKTLLWRHRNCTELAVEKLNKQYKVIRI